MSFMCRATTTWREQQQQQQLQRWQQQQLTASVALLKNVLQVKCSLGNSPGKPKHAATIPASIPIVRYPLTLLAWILLQLRMNKC